MKDQKNIRRISLKTKFASASMILALVLSLVIVLISYFSYRDSMFKRYEENITALVKTASVFIPVEKIDQYYETGQVDEDYELLLKEFQTIQEQNHLEFLYAYVPTEQGIKVFAQGTKPRMVGHFVLGGILGGEYFPQEDIDAANRLFDDPDAPKVVITNESEFGYLISAFNVLRDDQGNPVMVVGADMSMKEINSTLFKYIILVSSIAAVILILFITIYLLFLNKSIIDPLQVIVDNATDFVNTNVDENLSEIVALNIDVKTGDEIEILAEAFNKMTSDIIRYIKELTSVTSERERIETELRIATLIQEGMLPRNFEYPDRDEFTLYASMRAAKDVGGDFYDFFFVDDDHFCITIGDVSGKGVPAALFMAMTKATVKDLVLRRLPVDEVMTEANVTLCNNNEQGMFVTLLIAIINVKTGVFQWCDAGHDPAIIWKKDGQVEMLTGKKGFVCAGIETAKYKMNESKIEKGDIIYLYTDGIPEANNTKKEFYGLERLQTLVAAKKEHDIKALCADILADVDEFADREPQFDDITMLGFKLEE
ncbi:PP2C family protein-serine/threonine phosphatase [Acetobacterium wieringae]|uniref:PP2C family protein-serine/threonine phosphatase n=1 Tax=Acetobacterium wieringae TaxID=52694 RepID=UPI0026F2BA69|nr:SpoIIE family protein phosphatase [Acetobacterium wieringae]